MQEQLISTLSTVAKDGAFRAGRGLSGLMGQEITIHVPQRAHRDQGRRLRRRRRRRDDRARRLPLDDAATSPAT